ncbi:hypothetical protein [Anatilimnocola floriformis]|nr:hypothetical protein [Anatilimnocola floriformis]
MGDETPAEPWSRVSGCRAANDPPVRLGVSLVLPKSVLRKA